MSAAIRPNLTVSESPKAKITTSVVGDQRDPENTEYLTQHMAESRAIYQDLIKDQHGNIIDGKLRSEVAKQNKIKVGTKVVVCHTDRDRNALRVALNTSSHPERNRAQKRSDCRKFLLANYDDTDKSIADQVGVDPKTVKSIREQMVKSKEIPDLHYRFGKDGHGYPVGRKPRAPQPRPVVIETKNRRQEEQVFKNLNILDQRKQLPSGNLSSRTLAKKVQKSNPPRPVSALPAHLDLRNADFCDLSLSNADLVFTDPEWKAIHLAEPLALKIKSWLRHDGVALVYSGHDYFDTWFAALAKHLFWQLLITIDFQEGNNKMWHKHVINSSRPIMVFSKSPTWKARQWINDRFRSEKDKEFHPWQASIPEAKYYIKALCPEKGLVVDPFLGFGTTAVATQQVGGGRRFVGTEILKERYQETTNRVAQSVAG